ncbi:uncharacterized protein LOC111345230 isoform X2 [Stylophora pistillata]|nr:uncharacterized protein LOC111345230 isoform X2 [Stylophora pistillata]
MQSKRIPNESITASSSKRTDNSPHFARLDGPKAWCSAPHDKLPYIQIQLSETKIITGIKTQGSSSDWAWVTKYGIKFLENGAWKEYNKELAGNTNVNGLGSNILDPPIRTQSIRIYPKNPVTLAGPDPKPCCLRLELYGCSAPGPICEPPISPYGSNIVYPAQQGNHENGSVVVFSCEPGFFLTGLPVIRCSGNTWTQMNFKCLLVCNEALDLLKFNIGFVHGIWATYIEVHLRKESFITAASIRLKDNRHKVRQIYLKARISNKWVQIGRHFKPPVSEAEEKFKLSQPVLAQSLQVLIITRHSYVFTFPTSTRVFGCKPVFRGCIIPGSAVLFREGQTYLKGRFISIARGQLREVVYGDNFLYKSKDEVILDEKPNLTELPEGTSVVGEDTRGILKEGKIKRVCSSTQCTIETDGTEWQSKLENVRVFRGNVCEKYLYT